MAAVRFTLNGAPVEAEVRTGMSLLELLREERGLTSVKDGCAPEGSCGACTVLVDGKAVVSCAQKAGHADGRSVVTQEGLSAAQRELWADCFVASGASQCGFCSPGIVMKAEGLLAKNPEPSRPEIARALAGNLCRCTGYVKIVDAIELAAGAKRGEPVPEPDWSGKVGSRTGRYQGRELALGDKPYVNDLKAEGMLHAAIRFSDHPRARVIRIDTTKAAGHPGVVAAATRQAAREAAALIEVEYEVLEPVTDPFRALDPGAPSLHDGGNLLSTSIVKRGDVDAALESSTHVLTETFRTQVVEHAFLEPESSFAVPEDGGFHVSSQGQGV